MLDCPVQLRDAAQSSGDTANYLIKTWCVGIINTCIVQCVVCVGYDECASKSALASCGSLRLLQVYWQLVNSVS